jgi:branched-chain amino acid transport system substrate-binding protein
MRTDQTKRGWIRALLVTAMIGVLAVAATACGDDDEDDGDESPVAGISPAATAPAPAGETITIAAGDKIKIGVSTTLTTDNAELGIPIRDAALLAAKEKGSILGFEIEVVAEDDVCSGPGSEAAAQKLITAGVVAVMGAMCSSGTVAAQDDYAREGLLQISSSSTAVPVTQQGNANFFRTAWNDATQGGEMAQYAFTSLNRKTAVLVNDQSVYGKGLMDVFNAAYTEAGGQVLSEEAVTVGEKDFSAVVTKIKDEGPEIVVFGGFIAEGAVLVRQLREADVTADFMGADGIADQDFIDQAAGAADGAYVSRGPQPLVGNLDEFRASFAAEYGADAGTQFTEHTYDAMQIIFMAIEAAGTVNADGDLEIDQAKMIAFVAGIDYTGPSGQIIFNDVGDRRVDPGAVNQIDQVKEGKLEKVS